MKQSGRVSLVMVFLILCVIFVVAVFLFSGESLQGVGGRFMSALARHDVDTLTKMSYLGNKSPDEIHKEWEFAVNDSGKYYRFRWKITAANQASSDTAAVQMQVARNSDNPGSYDENFQLPLIKRGNEWKVDVGAISSEMFPGIPRK